MDLETLRREYELRMQTFAMMMRRAWAEGTIDTSSWSPTLVGDMERFNEAHLAYLYD